MPPRKDKVKLNTRRSIVLTLEGSEEMLERLATLLIFATTPYKIEAAKELGPMPWEDKNDPQYVPPDVKPELNYELIRRDIVTTLKQYAEAGRVEEAKAIVREYGEKVSLLHQDKLLPLYHDLTDRLNPETPASDQS